MTNAQPAGSAGLEDLVDFSRIWRKHIGHGFPPAFRRSLVNTWGWSPPQGAITVKTCWNCKWKLWKLRHVETLNGRVFKCIDFWNNMNEENVSWPKCETVSLNHPSVPSIETLQSKRRMEKCFVCLHHLHWWHQSVIVSKDLNTHIVILDRFTEKP